MSHENATPDRTFEEIGKANIERIQRRGAWKRSQSPDKYAPPDGIEWTYQDHVQFCVVKAVKKIEDELLAMFSEGAKSGIVEIDTASLTYDPEEWKRKIFEDMPPMSEESKALLDRLCEAEKSKEAQA